MADTNSTTNRIAQFEDRLTKQVFQPGATIFRTGEMDDTAYIVKSGDVQIFTRSAGGQPVLLTTLGPGQIVGELALLNERTRTATARTEHGCELLIVRPQQIAALLDNAPPFLRFWIEHLANRVIDLTKRIG
jgi:CRP-like cAMP-binding protein